MYKHTQLAWVIWAIITWIATFLAMAAVLIGNNIGVIGFALVLILVAVAFYGLTVEVDKEKQSISWWFGPGVAKKSVPFSDIAYVKPVRNSFRHGIGMRISNDGWVYSVSGFSAIEITLHDGMKYRIGTNDQSNLLAAFPNSLTEIQEMPEPEGEVAASNSKKRKDPFDIS